MKFLYFFAKLRFINQGDVKYSKSRFFSQVLEFQNFEIFIRFSWNEVYFVFIKSGFVFL
jgi:hypothetical protein